MKVKLKKCLNYCEMIVRVESWRTESPSTACIDSLSVKVSHSDGLERGVNGGKKVKVRKKHILTDTLGLLLVVVVHAANGQLAMDSLMLNRISK